MPTISPARRAAQSASLSPGGEKSALTAKPPLASGPEHGRSLAGFGLTAIVLALVAFYAWVATPPKPPPVPEGETVTSYDSLFGIAAREKSKLSIVGGFGLILSSSDGGQSWKQQTSGTSKTLTSVSFADSLHGFAVGSGGVVLATQDGGSTWKTQASDVKAQLLAIQSLSSMDAVAVGAYGTVLATHDGGIHWSKINLPWDALIPVLRKTYTGLEPNLNNLFFVDRNTGWLVGEYGIVLKTVDGGSTWITQRVGEELPQLYSLVFTDPTSGWAVGQAGSLIHTTDGGATFQELKVTQEDLYSIAMRGPRGVIVGNHTVLLTRDGGSDWVAGQALPGSIWLSDVALAADDAVAVGSAGTILNIH